jgi:hypothetical protein
MDRMPAEIRFGIVRGTVHGRIPGAEAVDVLGRIQHAEMTGGRVRLPVAATPIFITAE